MSHVGDLAALPAVDLEVGLAEPLCHRLGDLGG